MRSLSVSVRPAREHVANKIGKIARPHAIVLNDDPPKTARGGTCAGCCATPRADAEVVEEIRTFAATAPPEE